MGNKKPGALSHTGLLVVDLMSEISNLEFLKDLMKVGNFSDLITTIANH
jgi:hypothetical protein